ncbi:SPASM domain-containing protein [Sporomusa sphaeroides DSM 2875]|uniref:radical SAM/SPASM domain-containing protein n=1 Tax=Sporomusa sphaeroides TaxID=47679 RepID=UPI00202F1A0D|nr:radical SAM/SPASM domain-containing protein [Sporomusa sphaeroides]MCM0758043.1 SPASM domain-containing protein [Sporomusa sphaeroides DSM 2875]
MIINYENILKYYFKNHFPKIHEWRENRKREKYKKRITQAIDNYNSIYKAEGQYPLFQTIEIETINRCNSTCSFCPVNKNADTREFKIMDQQLFISILQQLKDLNYSGSIGLYSNNEPFLDERIVDLARLAKEQLPNNHLYLYTNGTLLTLKKFLAIIQHLDRMYIDNYNDKLKLSTPVKTIHKYCKDNKLYLDKVRIRLRKLNDVLSTRGGQAPNRKQEKIEPLTYGCYLPFRQMVIRPDGKVSLCCNDALGTMTLGDLTKETIGNVWYGETHRVIQEKITKGRYDIDLCRGCDSML